MDQISINGFSLGIMNPIDTRKKVINGANYFLMRHGSSYKLKLYNDRSTKCDAEVWIDGEKVGVWRIEAYGSTTIERPVGLSPNSGCQTRVRTYPLRLTGNLYSFEKIVPVLVQLV